MPRTKGEHDRLRCVALSHCAFGTGTLYELLTDLELRNTTDSLEDVKRENVRLSRELAIRRYQKGNASDFSREVVHLLGKIVEISQRIFPDGSVTFDYAFDPENPSDQWLTFNVVAKGEYKDYCDREFQWHEEIERIVPGTLTEFRLCVMPQR